MRDKLIILIDELGVSQSELARQMGVGKSSVYQWYKGDRTPKPEYEERFWTWLEKYKARVKEL